MKKPESKKEIVLSAHKYMWTITKGLHGRYVAYAGFILIGQVISTLIVMMIGKSIDAFNGLTTFLTFGLCIVVLLVLHILRSFFAVSEATYHIKKIAYDMEGCIEAYTIGKLFRFSPGQINRENTGLKMDTLQKGSAAIGELLMLLMANIIPTTLKLVLSLILLSCLHWVIALTVFVCVTLFVVSSFRINDAFTDEVRRVRKLDSDLETKFWEIIKNLKLVITTASQDNVLQKYRKEQEIAHTQGKKVWVKYNLTAGYLRNLPFEHLVQAPLLLLIFYFVRKGEITIGDLAMVITLIGQIYIGINNIGSVQRSVIRHSVNVNRLKELVEQPIECGDVPDSIELVSPRGKIEFKGVTFSYGDNGSPALKDVSFIINPGETVAFVGKSGSGKSTIVSLILRGHTPQCGEILIDDIPLGQIVIDSWRRSVGTVSQQTMLWDDTLRHNVLFGTNGIGPERLNSILEAAHITEFRDRLGENGIDTIIGENGVELSGGQCQRIAIARVLARDPHVIIFDEATSALDYHTEAGVYQAIEGALQGRTGIIIAHRLGTVRKANRIIVLDKGSIVGEGTFEELSADNDYFKQLIGSELR